jgi:glycosyltransferase involved in cell wall biosynthesis
MTRFSIVIPCYNAERWLAEAIRSCLDQTVRDLEVVVVDDGSTDRSRAIAETAAAADPRVRVIHQDNQGVGAARNAGLHVATGEYVNFLDADDLLEPEKLAVQGAVLDDNPRIDCVLCDATGIDADGGVVMEHLVDSRRLAGPVRMFDLFFSGGQFPPLIPLLRRRVAIAAGGFDTDREVAGWADTAFWMRIGAAGATHHFVGQRLCRYRMHAGSMSANHEAMDEAALRVYTQVLRERPDDSARALRSLQARLSDNDTALAALRGCVRGLEDDLRQMADDWRVTRETLHADRQLLGDAVARLDYLRAATARLRRADTEHQEDKSETRMQRLVIFDAGETGQRLWEALAPRASVEVVAFVDPDVRRHERTFLGLPVHPVEWLRHSDWDLVAAAGADTHAWRFPLAAAGVGSRRIVECPTEDGDEFLREIVAEIFPDPLAATLAATPETHGLRLGIFGTGSGAMKVWEVLTGIESADAVWFADNNPQQQGRELLGLEIIAPTDIAARPFDAVVIGSMSRDPIRRQLLDLSIPAAAIIEPDVTSSITDLERALANAITKRRSAA